MQFNLSNLYPTDGPAFLLTQGCMYVLGYYIMGKLQPMSGNTFLIALVRPLSLYDIKNVIEFANPAF